VLDQLPKQPDMLADIQERFQYVLIDEFQDTNAAQWRLSHLVADHYAANDKPNLMAVGDDDQSIFAFNGAELNNMLSFRRDFPASEIIVLSENYRSTQPVLDSARQIIEQAEDRLVKRDQSLTKNLVSQSSAAKSDIKHLSYPTRQHQQTAVAENIKQLWYDGERDIAVLARKHDSLKQLASTLLGAGVPVRYEQQSNILEHEAVQQIMAIAKLAVAIADGDRDSVNLLLSELLRHPMWPIKPKTLWTLAAKNYSSPDWLQCLLEHDDEDLKNIANWLIPWLTWCDLYSLTCRPSGL
jgi:DNA helicase-2/ATP-dependent DNA helicase PcrA